MRTREGMKVAKAKGRLRGKQPKLSTKQEAHLVALYQTGEHTIGELEELFSITRSTVYRTIARDRSVWRPSPPVGRQRCQQRPPRRMPSKQFRQSLRPASQTPWPMQAARDLPGVDAAKLNVGFCTETTRTPQRTELVGRKGNPLVSELVRKRLEEATESAIAMGRRSPTPSWSRRSIRS
jgi:hypothetical protein